MKFLSVESVGSLLVVAFAFGAGYTTLSAESAEMRSKLLDVQEEQKSVVKDVASIQTDTAVIKNDNRHIRKQLEDQKEALQRVIDLLEERR